MAKNITVGRKPRKRNYINNADLLVALSEYVKQFKEGNGERPKVSPYIVECIYSLSENYGKKSSFNRYSFLDEMKADGVLDCIKYMHNFDPNKTSNPFAYMTQIIHNAFIRRIKKEQVQQYAKIKNMFNTFSLDELNDAGHRNLYDNNLEFLDRFEKNLKAKKAPAKKQGVELFFDKDE